MEPGGSDLAVCVSQSVWYKGGIAACLSFTFVPPQFSSTASFALAPSWTWFGPVLLLTPPGYVRAMLSYEKQIKFINLETQNPATFLFVPLQNSP